jgi:hypothetical protein
VYSSLHGSTSDTVGNRSQGMAAAVVDVPLMIFPRLMRLERGALEI